MFDTVSVGRGTAIAADRIPLDTGAERQIKEIFMSSKRRRKKKARRKNSANHGRRPQT